MVEWSDNCKICLMLELLLNDDAWTDGRNRAASLNNKNVLNKK